MNVLPILKLVVAMARVLLVLFALINLTGLVWFAGSYSWLFAISGVVAVIGSVVIALIPQGSLHEHSTTIAYSLLLFLTAAAIMLFVYSDLFGSSTSTQRAEERMFHILLLVLVGGSVLRKTTRVSRNP